MSKEAMKIRLVGYSRDPIDIVELEVVVAMEGFVFLRMIDSNGRKYETGCLREES